MKRLVCSIPVLMLGLSHRLLASSHHANSHGSPEINWWGLGSSYSERPALGWLFLTFFIFIGVIMWAIKKPLSLYLEARSNDIRRAIEEGQKAKLESEQKLRVYEEKLNSLDQEITKMKEAFAEQAQAEHKLKEQMTKESSARILKDAEDSINANFERSKNKLAEEVITSAIAKAQTSILQNYLSDVDSYLKESLVADIKNYAKEA